MAREAESKKKTKREGMATIALLIIFVITLMPLILVPFSNLGNDTINEYSILNEGDKGLSKFYDSIPNNHDVYTLMSSYNELTPNKTDYLTENTILISVGPKKLYNPMEIIPLAEYLGMGGKMVLAMDLGTANELFLVQDIITLILSIFNNTIYGDTFGIEYDNGVVVETDSNFYYSDSTSLKLWGPCISAAHPLVAGVNTIRMDGASKISIPTIHIGGGYTENDVAISTTTTAFFDENGNQNWDLIEEISNPTTFPLVLSLLNNQVIIITDADIFSNTLYDEEDNAILANNIITSLAGGEDCLILFDEVHQVKLMPNFFGLILMLINANNTFLFALPLTPLLIYMGIKRFIPVPKKPKITKKSKVLKEKGKTLYGERMKWFKERREYNKAITLLARRLKRTLIRSLELKHYDIDNIITQIKLVKPNANINRIKFGLKKIEDVEKNKKKIKEEYEFLNLYYEMRWISDAVTK